MRKTILYIAMSLVVILPTKTEEWTGCRETEAIRETKEAMENLLIL